MPDSDKIPQRNEMTQYAKADISNNPFPSGRPVSRKVETILFLHSTSRVRNI
jgi:hypothetical protein